MLADIVKIATFSSFFIHLAFCQNFAPDSDTNIIPGGTVKLVCNITVAAFIATVTLSKDNVQKSFCDNANICTPYSSDSGRYQYSSNSSVVTVQISNLTKASDEGTWTCQVGSSSPVTYIFVFPSATEPDNEGSATTESTLQSSTDRPVITTAVSETSSKMSTESLSHTQSTVTLTYKSTLEENTLPGSTESNGIKPETSIAPVTATPSGLSEEMIIIVSTVSIVGGILLIVIIVIVVFCCKQRTDTAKSEKYRNKPGKFYIKHGSNKDLNSNYEQSQEIKHPAPSARKIQGGTDLCQKHPKNDILYGSRRPSGVEYLRSQNYHQQNYFHRNQHNYRNQNNAYYLPYTDSRNVMYYQRYPGSGYNEYMLGYNREGPFKMQQLYPNSYTRQDRYTDDGLERRIGHGRGEYESYWADILY